MNNNRLATDQIAYSESVSNPRTGAELLLALLNPHSKAHKDLMNLIELNETIHVIVDRMLLQLDQEKFLASKQEKDDIRRYIIAIALAEQEKAQLQIPPKIRIHEDELSHLSLTELKERLDTYTVQIHDLKNENQHLTHRLDELKQDANENTKQWESHSRKTANTFQDQLAAQHIPLVLGNGKTININTDEGKIEAKKIIDQTFNAPAPIKVLEVIGASWQKLNKQADPSIPPPPPLPPHFSNAPAMACKANVMNEIRFIGACAGSDSGVALLKSLKENAAARKLLPGASMTLRPAPGKKIPSQENDQTTIFKKAIDIYAESTEKKQALQYNEGAIKRLEATLNAEQTIYDKRKDPSLKP